MFYQLPPVGNPIKLAGSQENGLTIAAADSSTTTPTVCPEVFRDWSVHFYDSGTASLAAAMLAAKEENKGKTRCGEVILPAYGCPDLVSAALFAGLKPVLVDLENARPWMDLAEVAEAITEDTVAVVAVNLFGINERIPALRELIRTTQAGQGGKSRIVLIEDSAQGFPSLPMNAAEASYWQGDMVVLSFGRGKPVSLMTGGAVLTPREDAGLKNLLPKVTPAADSVKQRLLYRFKAALYNAMIHPQLYWLPQSLPFLHLGETRFHELETIAAMDVLPGRLLQTNLAQYYEYDSHITELAECIRRHLAGNEQVLDVAGICGMPVSRRLLRYPLLVPAGERDTVYQALRTAGLGASIMYPGALPSIEGLRDLWGAERTFPNAEDFSARLITLPTHGRISVSLINKMLKILPL